MNDIQSLFHSCGGTLVLQPGEYEGPLVIDRPCTLEADNAVLWAQEGPVLRIEAGPVTIRRLRVEVTGADDGIAILTTVPGVTLEDVEICGELSGFDGETSHWDLPGAISLGDFAAGRRNSFSFELDAPAAAQLSAGTPQMQVFPARLAPGVQTVTVELNPLPDGACLDASLFVTTTTGVRRRIALTGNAVRKAPLRRSAYPLPPSYVADPGRTLEIVCEDASGALPPDGADAYVFLLGADGGTRSDGDLIFYGNPASALGDAYAKQRDRWPSARFLLCNAAPETQSVAVCFAVDYRTPERTFVAPRLRVFVDDEEIQRVDLPERRGERILIAVELWRDGAEWRMELTRESFRDGLTALCRSYGVDAVFSGGS